MVNQNDLLFVINKQSDYNINYGAYEHEVRFSIPFHLLYRVENLHELYVNKYKLALETLYSVELERKNDNRLFVLDNIFGFDIFYTIFFHISRIEETIIKQGDYLGNKKKFEDQLLVIKNGIYKIPVVDELIAAFLKVILNEEISQPKYFSLSHDIDHIRKFHYPLHIIKKIGGHLKHHKGLSGISYLLKSYSDYLFRNKDAFDSFDYLLSLSASESDSDSHKYIFYLVGGNHSADTTYNLEDPIFLKSIVKAREKGYQSGIHPSFESWNDLSLIKEQKSILENIINEDITISRQHYLNFDIQITPKLLLEAGIKVDSSLGYTRHVGYRCGTAYPYHLYDFENERMSELLEIPIVFMDSSWLHECLNGNVVPFEEAVNSVSGCFNFHNTFFDEMAARNKDLLRPYLEFIKQIL